VDHFNSHSSTAFCVCRRFPACWNAAHCGPSITSSVISSPRCAAFQQAGNRLHTQKAVLEWLLK